MPGPACRTTRRPACRTVGALAALLMVAPLGGCGSDDNAAESAPAAAPPTITPSPASTASTSPAPAASAAPARINVAARDEDSCALDSASVPAGPAALAITNTGAKKTEVYIFAGSYANGGKIVGEREGIDPGSTAELIVELGAGDYEIRCKPGTIGNAAHAVLKVTPGQAATPSGRAAEAVRAYRDYVAARVDDTIAATKTLVASIKAGDLNEAKKQYAPSRVGWESIEPVAESFGDIDPKVDLREADLESGQSWTGWHKIEKSLFAEGTTDGTAGVADQLLADLGDLRARVPSAEITPTSMANGAKELLDEVASGKITGEEEAFSHTDLVDFKANLDGARKVFDLLKPIVDSSDAELSATLTREFSDAETALAGFAESDGYMSYDKVTESQRKQLSDVVNALGEPLSKLAAAVVGD